MDRSPRLVTPHPSRVQIDMTFNSYLHPEAWEAMPMRPMELKKAGREVFFVSRQSGMLRGLPGLEEIRKFESFRRQEVSERSVLSPVSVFARTEKLG